MIPDLISLAGAPWKVLPEGIHQATLDEVEAYFAYNATRRHQFEGLVRALTSLKSAGVLQVFLDGSFVTGKPIPGDYDACWDPTNVDIAFLDPVFLDFANKRARQKTKYLGEFFLASHNAIQGGPTFLDFFQQEKHTGLKKGIILIDLSTELSDEKGGER